MFLKSFNVLNPLLYFYKYRYKHSFSHDPYQQIKELVRSVFFKKKQPAKKVLIVPFRMADSNLFEGNCALLFKSRGYDVDALMCGQAITFCEQIDFSRKKNLRCNLCFHEQNKFLSSFDLNGIFINQYLSAADIKVIEKEVNDIDLNHLTHYTYRNVPIYRPLSSALHLYFKKSSFCVKTDETIVRGYLKTIFIIIQALDHYFAHNKVELVLFSHGVYATWGTIHEYCLQHQIKFVTWGREYHGAGVIASHNASYLYEPLYEKNSIWDQHPLTSKQKKQIMDYLGAKVGLNNESYDFVNYNAHIKKHLPREEVYRLLDLDREKKVIALFPNIPWDGQVFRPNFMFASIDDWIYQTIEWFEKREDCVLIIRAHPAELHANNKVKGIQDLIQHRYSASTLSNNILVIPPDSPISSLSVAAIANAALLYGSTIGYETTFLRVPTILASKFFYSDKEITFDPKTQEQYFTLIEQAIAGLLQVDDARWERLLQYAYHYKFRRVMPETLMDFKGLTFDGYKYKRIEELVSDKILNQFIDKCLSGDPFYFDECYE